jgi:dihydropteroate synthase
MQSQAMTINCRGQLIDLKQPSVMGILNVTPDSFFDGGKYATEKAILSQVERMLLEGATFIDIGAYSSKPNGAEISQEQELSRLLPALQSVVAHFPEAIISVDSFRAEVAKAAIENGAAIINDISAGSLDSAMMSTIAHYRCRIS